MLGRSTTVDDGGDVLPPPPDGKERRADGLSGNDDPAGGADRATSAISTGSAGRRRFPPSVASSTKITDHGACALGLDDVLDDA